MYSVAMCNKNI